MKRRPLGRTGLEISEIGFGCGVAAGLLINGSATERSAAVARAIELGINYFDTAPVYGDSVSETHLGLALEALGAAGAIVASKVALEWSDLGDIFGAVVASVEASIARLRLDRLPLIQLPNRVGPARAARGAIGSGAVLTVDDVLGERGVLEAFRSLRERGRVAWFGCCAYGGDIGAIERLIDSRAFDAMLVNYSVLNTSAWRAPPVAGSVRDYGAVGRHAAQAGMGAVALRVLEGGALSGSDGRHPNSGGSASPDLQSMIVRAAGLARALPAAEAGLTDLAIRFVLANPSISTALIGVSDLAQVEAAVAAAVRGPLGDSEIALIEQLRARDFDRGDVVPPR